MLSASAMLFAAWQVRSSDHKFCQVITGVTAVPVPQPADPAANPSREKQYELYMKFVASLRPIAGVLDMALSTWSPQGT